MNKKQKFDALFHGNPSEKYTLFYPILMHFAARFNGNTYGEFASDYKVLVESNINPVFIETASSDEVLRVCKEAIYQEKERKFILSGGCEITVNTPVENLMAMSESRK